MAIFPTKNVNPDKPDGLTDRQRAFAVEYLCDRRPKAAAVRAGYSERTAAQSAWRLLQHPAVRAFIDAADRARSDRLTLSVDRVVLEHARLAFADMGTLVRLTRKGPRLRPGAADGMVAVREVRRFKGGFHLSLHDKSRSLDTVTELLGIADRMQQKPYDPAERIRVGREVRERLMAEIARLAQPVPTPADPPKIEKP